MSLKVRLVRRADWRVDRLCLLELLFAVHVSDFGQRVFVGNLIYFVLAVVDICGDSPVERALRSFV